MNQNWTEFILTLARVDKKHTYVSHVRMIPRNPDAILTTMLTSLRFFTGIGPMQQKQVAKYSFVCIFMHPPELGVQVHMLLVGFG